MHPIQLGIALKQILQSLKSGSTTLEEVASPKIGRQSLNVRSLTSLISAGTERMLLDFGKGGLLTKARQQPDKVRMVLHKMRSDGIAPTLEAVFRKLDQPISLGYCNVGRVIEAGNGITGIGVGDRVASNGVHAEVVNVPQNLCCRVPETVTDEEASFTVLGAIALQGIRLVKPTLGEAIVVTGLGLIGLVTVQLLRAHGCRVLGLDFDPQRLEMARQFGAEAFDLSNGASPEQIAKQFSRGRGVDAVIVTASTTSNEPVHQAAQMSRKRGRIVLVGVVGLELSRADFFEKELTFQVSCSYGPGRYDPDYEDNGHDYPVGYVRWTEQRNFEAVLDMMADKRLDVGPLISHRFAIEDAERAYEVVGGTEPSLGILLTYPNAKEVSDEEMTRSTIQFSTKPSPLPTPGPKLGFIGAGNYAAGVLLPAFKAAGGDLQTVVTSGGLSGTIAGEKFGFKQSTTDLSTVFADSSIDALVISTRHNSHASMVVDALKANKHVFVEKPLCLTLGEIASVRDALSQSRGLLMVGFNRRYAPQVQKIKSMLSSRSGPISLNISVNAGAIPTDHWTQDMLVGGGRIVGEACHFIDLARFLTGSEISHFSSVTMKEATADTAALSLGFADGSIASIQYFANGNKSLPKERLEVFSNGAVLQLDNFRKLTGFGWPGFKKMNVMRQDKGQQACVNAFIDAVKKGDEPPIPYDEIFEVSQLAIEIAESKQ